MGVEMPNRIGKSISSVSKLVDIEKIKPSFSRLILKGRIEISNQLC